MSQESTRATTAPYDPNCPECKGTGERDSGGTHPWGEPAMLPCDCNFAQPSPSTGGEPATDSTVTGDAAEMIYRLKEHAKHVHNPAGATGRLLIDAAWMVEHLAREAAREPAPVARELDVDAERRLFAAALKQTWNMADPYSRAQPGSWATGHRQGVADALNSIKANFDIEVKRARATAESAPASAAPDELPAILFDGHAVYVEITRKLGRSHCISYQSVSATLDAVARLIRAPSNSPVGAKEQDNG